MKPVTLVLHWLVVVAAFITLGCFAKGVYQYATIPETGYDYRLRWTETQYVIVGIDPYPLSFAHQDASIHSTRTEPAAIPELGYPEMANYPGWIFLWGMPLFAPPMKFGRWIMLVANALAWTTCLAWCYRFARRLRPECRWFGVGLAAAAGCNLAAAQTIINGNLGLVVLAALLVAHDELTRGRGWPAGLWLCLAMLKPTITVPVILAVALKRDRTTGVTLAMLTVGLAAGVAFASALTGAGYIEMALLYPLEGAKRFAVGGAGLWKVVGAAGVSKNTALISVAAFFIAATLPALWAIRRQPLIYSFAVAAVCARLFTYHNTIDNVMLLPLVAALWALKPIAPRTAGFTLSVTVLTLLAPAVLADRPVIFYSCATVWLAGAGLIIKAGLQFNLPPSRDSDRCVSST